jgi:hypothetical protein
MQLYLACIELLTYVTFVRLTSVWISGCMVKVFFSFFSWIKICMHKVRLKVVESLEHFSSSVLWICDAEAWYLPSGVAAGWSGWATAYPMGRPTGPPIQRAQQPKQKRNMQHTFTHVVSAPALARPLSHRPQTTALCRSTATAEGRRSVCGAIDFTWPPAPASHRLSSPAEAAKPEHRPTGRNNGEVNFFSKPYFLSLQF